jgi:anti-sigma B factor antagonist
VRISIRFEDDVAIMSLDGKFLAGADGPFLRQKVKDLIDAGTAHLVIDFTEVPYIDSTGLGFLAGTRETAEASKVSLALAALNEHVLKVLDSVKLAPFFVITKDVASAVAKVKRAAGAAAAPKSPKARKMKAQGEDDSGDSETLVSRG